MTVHPPKFSVLGDSISTFQGYCPVGAEHYAPDTGAATGVYTVEDTWWMQVIRAQGGVYLSNQSISGNTISPAGTMGGFSQKRLRGLSVEEEGPDHILLYAGLNDANFGIPLDVFAREYQALLGNLLALYPQVQIHCGTLLLGAIAGTTNSMACFVQRLVPYNEAIRAAVQATGCHRGPATRPWTPSTPPGKGCASWRSSGWVPWMARERKNNRLLKIFSPFLCVALRFVV